MDTAKEKLPTLNGVTNSISDGKNKKKTGCCSLFFIVILIFFLLLGLIGALTDSDDTDSDKGQSVSEETANETDISDYDDENESAEDNNTDVSNKSVTDVDTTVFDAAKEKLSDYNFITGKDFGKYFANLKKEPLYFVAEYTGADDYNENGYFTATISGCDYSCYCYTKTDYGNYSDILKEGDKIIVFGKLSDYESVLGIKWFNFKACKIVAYGSEVSDYKKSESDESLSDKLVVTAKVVKALGADNVTEKEFKSVCKSYNYTKILRNPDDYDSKYCCIKGTVDQVIEGLLNDTIYLKDSSGNIWGCTYRYDDGESHLLEGDSCTLYGVLDGTTTSTTVLGKQVTMPYVQIKYID